MKHVDVQPAQELGKSPNLRQFNLLATLGRSAEDIAACCDGVSVHIWAGNISHTRGVLTHFRQSVQCADRGVAMRSKLTVLAAGVFAVGLQMPAHHSGAAVFDSEKPINLTGVVTKVEWVNPHAHFYMDVKDASGKVTNWNLELASPNVLVRNGWKRTSVKEGDSVTITGQQARDNTKFGIANTIVFPDGRKLNFLSAYENDK
jgi:hypothetical protein